MLLHIHLFEFFKFYSQRINTREVGISIRQGGFAFFKNDQGLGKDGRIDAKLAVESPIMVLDDVGGGAFAYTTVKKHFKMAVDLLKTRGFLSESFLKLIISGELFDDYQDTS